MRLYSILIACYNSEKYIFDAIDSALNQTYKEIEIIICNDGSTDNTQTMLERLASNRIKILNNIENKGVGFTKKKLIDSCSGNFFLFLDSDDLLVNECIEKFDDIIEMDIQNGNNNIGIYYGQSYLLNVENKLIKWDRSKEIIDNLLNQTFEYPIFHPVFYNRQFYSRILDYSVSLKTSEDFDLWYKYEEVSKIKFIDIAMYIYRANGNGISQVNGDGKKWLKIMLEHFFVAANASFRRSGNIDLVLENFTENIQRKFQKKRKNKFIEWLKRKF
jgi:glycosyltransferase involved in cell wall biosynthesis